MYTRMISVGRVFGEGVIKNRKTKPLRPWRFVWGWQKKFLILTGPPGYYAVSFFARHLSYMGYGQLLVCYRHGMVAKGKNICSILVMVGME